MSEAPPYRYNFEQDFDGSSSRYTPFTHRQGSVGLGIYVATPVPIPSGPVLHGEIREVTYGDPSGLKEEDAKSDESWYTAEEQLDTFDPHPLTATGMSRWATATQPTRSTLDLLAGQGRYWKCQTIREWNTDVEIELDVQIPYPELPVFLKGAYPTAGQEIPESLDTEELTLRLELLAFRVDVARKLASLLEAINGQIEMEGALVESFVLESEPLLLDELE